MSEPDLDELSDSPVVQVESEDELISASTTLESVTLSEPETIRNTVKSDIPKTRSAERPLLTRQAESSLIMVNESEATLPPEAQTNGDQSNHRHTDFGHLKLFPGKSGLKEDAQIRRPQAARSRLESWVEPPSGGQEAPNGDSIV